MFSLLGGIYSSYFASPQINLLVVGGQGVGKTTLLERLKVTQFGKPKVTVSVERPAAPALPGLPTVSSIDIVETPVPVSATKTPKIVRRPPPKQVPQSKARSWICPAPPKYANAVVEEEDDEEDEGLLQPQPLLHSKRTSQASMESVELVEEPENDKEEDEVEDYDLKPKAKMLPLHKIRPTIGMNLAKLDLCGAKIHVWDLGGKLIDLWERYYQDCDALVFVWQLGVGERADDDERPILTTDEQLKILEQVRAAIPDDIPFLILGNCQEKQPVQTDVLYSTAQFLPHYHNPCQALFFCNAATGRGVRSAFEWLIPLASRQQKVREK